MRSSISFAIIFSLAACSSMQQSKLEFMEAPGVFSADGFTPFELDAEEPEGWPYPVHYATDRLPGESPNSFPFYENDRGNVLRLGVAQVMVKGEDIDWLQAKELSLLKNRDRKYPLQVSSVDEIEILSSSKNPIEYPLGTTGILKPEEQLFADSVDRQLGKSSSSDIYIYIHGFKVPFDNPLPVSTELWHFMGYRGAIIGPYSSCRPPTVLGHHRHLYLPWPLFCRKWW